MTKRLWLIFGIGAIAVLSFVWAISSGFGHHGKTNIPIPQHIVPTQKNLGFTVLLKREQAYLPFHRRATAAVAAPILMYHYIRVCTDPEDTGCPSLSVSPDTFDAQMKWLHDHGYVSVDPSYYMSPHTVNGKPILLTFDDGYQDVYDAALPILKKYGYTATMYIITGKVGLPGYVTWPEVVDLDRQGMTIGSHTINHLDLRKVTNAELTHEIVTSKQEIEIALGHAIYDFCYPFGYLDDRVVAEVKKTGYVVATTTQELLVAKTSNMLKLPRMRIRELTDMSLVVKGIKSEAWRNANATPPAPPLN